MTPLIICPARQMSEGRPCKNREAWPALMDTLSALPNTWTRVLITDDPFLHILGVDLRWLTMGPHHTVSQAARIATELFDHVPHDLVVVLQPSSPARNRHSYVMSAVAHLERFPDHSSVVSVVPWTGEPPSKACTLSPDGHLVIPATPEARQAQPRHYRRDGTVYAVRAQYARQGDLYGPAPIPLLIDPADSVTLD